MTSPNPNVCQTFNPSSLATLQSHFADLESSKHGEKWDQLWADGFAPWDRGRPNPALDDVLAERRDLFGSCFVNESKIGGMRKKALVPGCGIGYDVLLLSAWGYDAYGLELSETALKGARAMEEKSRKLNEYRVRDAAAGKGKVVYLTGDFFKNDFLGLVEGEGTFDVIYDYTFLCALPPSLRPSWALRYTQLLTPTGRLICLEFPSTKAISSGGPPYALPPKVYEGHLPRPGQELPYNEGDLLQDKLGPEAKEGLKRLDHIKPKRTHEAGMKDGKVEDWISVWGNK